MAQQRIYIAGKITGMDETDAYESFVAAENVIRKAGHEPLNPMRLVDQTPGRTYNEYLFDALRVLMFDAEAVYFLDNWIDSKGARIEFEIAKELEMAIYTSFDEIPVATMSTASAIFGKTPML